MSIGLTSFPTLVEVPFIQVKIGDYTLGQISRGAVGEVQFPNFIDSLKVTKINGQLNLYTLSLKYQVSVGDDPNLLEKIFSTVLKDRKIWFTYGDYNYPQKIFKEEEALITNVTSTIDAKGLCLSYTVSAISTALALEAVKSNFPGISQTGSSAVVDLIQNPTFKLKEIFPALNKVSNYISHYLPTDDAVVDILSAIQSTTLDRLRQIVNSMKSVSDPDALYGLVIHDEKQNELNGAYFEVKKVSSASTADYKININYGQTNEDNFITEFSLQNTSLWSILYEISDGPDLASYTQKIDGFGKLITLKSPTITRGNNMVTTQEDTNWWKQVTEFPIQASISIKGLIRPSILMDTVEINIYFYGRKHIASGVYAITKQEDSVDGNGYKTTLSLLRTGSPGHTELVE